MNIKRIILLTLILIGLSVVIPLGFYSNRPGRELPPLDPEHLTEEYEFKDTKIIWRLEEEGDENELVQRDQGAAESRR